MIDFHLEHICSYNATLDPSIEVIGPVPEGFRFNGHFTGGAVCGPKLRGKVSPGGGFWAIVRTDGMEMLDVRFSIETHDGAVVYVDFSGLVDWGEDGYQKFLRAEPIASGIPIRTTPRFHTSHADYQWLNRLLCVGIGQVFLERSEVVYDVYAVR